MSDEREINIQTIKHILFD